MISLWQMIRGRMVAAIAAALAGLLAFLGIAELTGGDGDAVHAVAESVVNLASFIAYALFHQWATKRKLMSGEVAVENLERMPRRPI